jgi:hypothetical protein
MKRYIKMFVLRGIIGIAIGVLIGHVFILALAFQSDTIVLTSDIVIKQFIFAGAVGFYCTGISVLFDIEEWSLLKKTVTHFIAMLPYLVVAYFAGWIPGIWWARVLFVLFFLFVYIIIWLSLRRYWKKRAAELNEGLQKLNQA